MNTLNWTKSEFPINALSSELAFVDFGMTDQKGRNIGCRLEIAIGKMDFRATPPARKKFTVFAHVTRNGKLFCGVSSRGIECESLEQAQVAAMDLAEKMRRRYAAKLKK